MTFDNNMTNTFENIIFYCYDINIKKFVNFLLALLN